VTVTNKCFIKQVELFGGASGGGAIDQRAV